LNDVLLVAVAVVLVIAVPYDWWVAYRFIVVARERPRLGVLNLAALRSIAIAIAATLGGLLGANWIAYYFNRDWLLDLPIPPVLIAIALVVISIPNVYALRLLKERLDE